MLVTLEGIDGSGKTSAWETLSEQLDDDVTFTREPTHSWYGDAVYKSLEDSEADELAELFLYTADHADHLDRVIRPALQSGNVVVCDRYIDSRYAYQAATLEDRLENPLEYIRTIHDPITRVPDLTIYLDVPAEVGADRSGATNKFEQTEYLSSVRDNYERIRADCPERYVTVDATQSQEAVLDEVVGIVNQTLREA